MKDKKKKVKNDESELLKNQLARALADYDNLKRRSEEEKLSWAKFSSLSIVSKSDITIFKAVGTALEDLATAVLVYEKVA